MIRITDIQEARAKKMRFLPSSEWIDRAMDLASVIFLFGLSMLLFAVGGGLLTALVRWWLS